MRKEEEEAAEKNNKDFDRNVTTDTNAMTFRFVCV